MKILVLGGYGNFGARICRALAADADIELMIGGRDLQRATGFAQSLGNAARGVRIDVQTGDLVENLRSLGAELVIHTAGPFQNQDYRVPHAAAAAGAHYIDLADGRRFVCDFPAVLDAAFRSAGRTAVAGASTVPALSSAVVAISPQVGAASGASTPALHRHKARRAAKPRLRACSPTAASRSRSGATVCGPMSQGGPSPRQCNSRA